MKLMLEHDMIRAEDAAQWSEALDDQAQAEAAEAVLSGYFPI